MIAQGLTRSQIRLVVIGLVTAMLLASMDQTVVSTALPTIASDLDETSLLSWVITAYLLTITASTRSGAKPVT